MDEVGTCHITIRDDYKPVLERAYVSGRFMWHIKAPNAHEAAKLFLELVEKDE